MACNLRNLRSCELDDPASNFLNKGTNILRSFKLDNKERITFPFSVSVMGIHVTKALTASLEVSVLHTCTSNQEAVIFLRRFSAVYKILICNAYRTHTNNMLISVKANNKHLKLIPQLIDFFFFK